MNRFRISALCLLLTALLVPRVSVAGENKTFAYVASKTNGICRYRIDSTTGAMVDFAVAAATANPQFFALHPTRPVLYAINSGIVGGKKSAVISAFAVDAKTGNVTLLNQQPATGGPTHLSVDHGGKNVLVASYGGGSLSVYPINEDSSLAPQSCFIQHQGSSVTPKRQDGPHAHQILTDGKDRFALVCDLGLDKVLIYKLDANKGVLVPNQPAFAAMKPGAGPRHLAFDPNGKFAYVINELDSTMTAFSFDSTKGAMTQFQNISTVPEGFSAKNSPAEVYMHPSGKFLYGSNRGHDSIVVYAIGEDGKLSLVQHQATMGKTPRHFAIDPAGKFLYAENQDTHNIVAYRIDAKTGRLTPTGDSVEINSPSCLVFFPER